MKKVYEDYQISKYIAQSLNNSKNWILQYYI